MRVVFLTLFEGGCSGQVKLVEGTTMESWIDRNNEYAGVTLDGVNEVASRYFKVDEMVEILAVPK